MAGVLEELGNIGSIAVSLTVYFAVGMGNAISAGDATESNAQVTARSAGIYSRAYVRVTPNTITATSTVNFRKNTANGNQTVSLPGSTTGAFEDTTHTDTISAGDLLAWQLVAGGTGTSIGISLMRAVFAATTDTAVRHLNTSTVAIPKTTTGYATPSGADANTATESQAQWTARTTATRTNLFVRVNVNSRADATTIKTRKNGADGNLTLSVGASATGAFEDTTHTDSLVSGDTFDFATVTGAGLGTITPIYKATDYTTTDATSEYLSGTTDAQLETASNVKYRLVQGDSGASNTEPKKQTAAGATATLSRLRITISANTCANAATLNLRVNTANGAQSVSIGAGSTGLFEDTTNTDRIVAGDLINYLTTTATSGGGTLTLEGIGVKADVTTTEGVRPALFQPTAHHTRDILSVGAVRRPVAWRVHRSL